MNEQPKIARTVAEAVVGDLLWHYDAERSRYDQNRKYLGRGVWSIATVLAVARVYLTAGDPAYPRSAGQFKRANGACKMTAGYMPRNFVYGSSERQSNWWSAERSAIAQRIERTDDLETLRTIAFALGMDGPPDFSAVPVLKAPTLMPEVRDQGGAEESGREPC